jgi:hypothetical protein
MQTIAPLAIHQKRIGPYRQQHPHGVKMTSVSRIMERSPSASVFGIYPCPPTEEEPHDPYVSASRSQV